METNDDTPGDNVQCKLPDIFLEETLAVFVQTDYIK